MPVGDILEVRVVCNINDQASINVLHYRVQVSVAPEPTNTDAAIQLDILFGTAMKNLIATAATYRGVGVRRIFPAPPTPEGFTTVGLGPGNATGDPLPTQTSGLITKKTQFAGRRFRGRFYVPFPAEGNNDNGQGPDATYAAALITLNTALITPVNVTSIGGGSWTIQPVLFHRATNTFDPLLPGQPRGRWATQRRRGGSGRPNPPPF